MDFIRYRNGENSNSAEGMGMGVWERIAQSDELVQVSEYRKDNTLE